MDSRYDLDMRPTHPRSLITFLCLIALALSSPLASAKKKSGDGSEEPVDPNCFAMEPEEAKQVISDTTGRRVGKLYGQLSELSRRSGIMSNAGSDKLDACQKSIDEFRDFCNDNEIAGNKDCANGGKSPVEGVDSSKLGKDKKSDLSLEDKTINKAISGANCFRARASCLKGGIGVGNQPKKSGVEKTCVKDIDEELEKISNSSDPETLQKKARLQAAKEMYQILNKKVFEPQAECLQKKGDYFYQVGNAVLNNYLDRGANSRTREMYNISCKTRQNSFEQCDYQINGQKRVEELNQSPEGKIGKVLEGAPGQVSGARGKCSGECLSSDGNCTDFFTANHCGPMDRGEVIDKNGQLQSRNIVECRQIGSVDSQICRFDNPVQTKPRFLRTIDESNSGSSCVVLGYTKKCGSGAYEKMSQQNPAQGQAVGFGGGKINLYRGDVYYDPERKQVFHNFMMWNGDSGAAITVNNGDGTYDVVAAQRWSSALDRIGLGNPINYQDFEKTFKIQSVSPMQLSAGTPTMWRLAKSIE